MNTYAILPRSIRRGVALGLTAGTTALAAACGVSTQQEVALGQQEAQQIQQQLPIVNDAAISRYINTLGNQLARQGPRQDIAFTFYVVNTDVLNAFSIPGGFVYVNRGIIERARNLSELAGVIGHEIGHVEERHSIELMQKQQNASIGLNLAYILLGRTPSTAEQAAIQVGGSAIFARYGRQAEMEADADGVALTTRAGIDPRGLPSFFQVLLDERKSAPSKVESWFQTHPIEEDRIASTTALINQIPPAQLSNLTRDTDAFHQFQARVRALPQPPRQFRAQ
jgi:predicted Zn-dependent protease